MSIEELLQQLSNSLDPSEKSKIRAKLRKLGHRGGAKSDGSSPSVRPTRSAQPVYVQPPPPHFDDSYYKSTKLSDMTDEKIIEALRHKGLPMQSELWAKLRMEWNNRIAKSGKLYIGMTYAVRHRGKRAK